MINFELYQHQADFCNDIVTRYLALIGGYGSGKTKALAVKLIILCILNAGFAGVALSPTYQMATRTLIPAIEDELYALNIPFKFNKSELTFTISIRGKTTILHILAAESYKRAAGLNLAFFGVDEADLLSAEMFDAAWKMLISRLRKGKVYQGVAVSTPEGFRGCYKYWVEDILKEPKLAKARRIIKAKTTDNKSLPIEFIEDLKAQYPPELLAAYMNGEFVNLKGLPVYYRYAPQYEQGNWTKRTVDSFPNAPLHIGLDYNKGINPCIVHVVQNDYRYAVDEFYGLRDTDECITAINKKYPTHVKHFYPDASGFEANNNYERTFGTSQVHYNPANPPVAHRVASLHVGMFNPSTKERRYMVNPDKCPQHDKSLQKQVYNSKQEPDKDGGYDHTPDAAGYFHHWYWPVHDRGLMRQALKL